MEAPAIGLGFYVLLVTIELIILKYFRKQQIPWREIVLNINSGHVLLWTSRAVVLGLYYYVQTNWSFNLLINWPIWLQWTFGFVVWDFCYYWMHRMHHTWSLLWKVHVVHHQGEHYGLSLGIRNSWFQSITSMPFYLWLAVLGLPLEIYATIAAIQITYQFYNHNQIVGKEGFLENFMVTPTHHKVHHGINPEYINKNHGGTLIIWDKLFGTFAEVTPNNPIIYGVDPKFETFSPLFANLELFGKDHSHPHHESDRHCDYPNYYVVACAIALYSVLLMYIHLEKEWFIGDHVYLVYLIFSGTAFIGGISNGNKRMLHLWIGHTLLLPGVFIFQSNLTDPLLVAAMMLLSLTGLLGVWIALRNKSKEKETAIQSLQQISEHN